MSNVENHNNLLPLNVGYLTTENNNNNCIDLHALESIIPENSQINIENSSDVYFGNVNNFNGPITIYQQTRNNSNECINKSNDILPEFKEEQNSDRPKINKKCYTKIISGTMLTIILIIIITISLILCLPKINENQRWLSQHQLISRSEWRGRPPLFERPLKHPTKYVIISHTASDKCNSIEDCSRLVRQFQDQHASQFNSPDVGYNFLIGGDENIYVGRGWDAINFHMEDSIGISYIGNYIYDRFTPGMIEAAQILLKKGVESGKLDENYKLISHNQTGNTLSPGKNIYNSIRFWPHFTSELVPIIP